MLDFPDVISPKYDLVDRYLLGSDLGLYEHKANPLTAQRHARI